ncbi:hypothetical protein M0802_011690 [Mischocyttarus mexicanus]|nr:hypothetical protein M0802_011690 [Mischocyttarus mexicanus]
MKCLSLIVLLIILFKGHCVEQYCGIDDADNCKDRDEDYKYTEVSNKKYTKYIEAINEAERNYIECNATRCECFNNIIIRDLKPFKKNGISKELIDIARTREKDCMFPSRCAGIEHFIFKIIDNLNDMDLVVNTRDYPQSNKHFGKPLPIFSFSKTPQYYDIMYPAWAFWEGGPAISLYPRGLGRWDQHRQLLDKASKNIPWDKKKEKVFFRGSRTSSERDNLILLSRENPNLIDAQYTKNQAWKSDEDTLHAPPASEVPLESHCAYKYLFNYRGVAASFRYKHLFLCRSLVFHVGDEWTEFYYDAMKPWIHFIPVPKDATQTHLKELIQFAIDNDALSEEIANRGRDFIWHKLRMKDITCFWKKLLKSYGKVLSYKPILDKHLIKIERK